MGSADRKYQFSLSLLGVPVPFPDGKRAATVKRRGVEGVGEGGVV